MHVWALSTKYAEDDGIKDNRPRWTGPPAVPQTPDAPAQGGGPGGDDHGFRSSSFMFPSQLIIVAVAIGACIVGSLCIFVVLMCIRWCTFHQYASPNSGEEIEQPPVPDREAEYDIQAEVLDDFDDGWADFASAAVQQEEAKQGRRVLSAALGQKKRKPKKFKKI